MFQVPITDYPFCNVTFHVWTEDEVEQALVEAYVSSVSYVWAEEFYHDHEQAGDFDMGTLTTAQENDWSFV